MQSGASADLSGLFDQPVHTLNLTPAHGGASIYQQSSLQAPGVNTPYGIQQNIIPGFQQNQIGGYQQTSMGGYQQNPIGGFQPNPMGGLPAPNNKMGMGMNPFNGPGLGVQIPQMQYNPGVHSVLQVGSGVQAGLRTAPPPPNQVQVQVPFSSPVPISHPSLQSSSSGPSLILSRSFTEPRPMEDDLDPLYSNSNSTSTGLVEEFPLENGNQSSFYLEENEEEEETREGENEGEKTNAPVAGEERKDGEQTSQGTKKGFFSLFSRAKDPGVQEKEDEKKTEEEEEEGRGGNEQKFLGEGQTFKGKLIGVLEVREARGDRMCQDALQELKMAIKASGEHKQKVIMQIAVDGLKIRDEKTGDCLYHHPVHKISFIAQDMTDIRAFGYIYGSPENGHRFFGIKTEKAAGQVVVAMRDLFQVVFELKKKEIEEAKSNMDKGEENKVGSAASFPAAAGQSVQQTAVDDLLGLVSEITAIQAGIQQIDKITPTPPNSFQTDSMITFSLPATTSPPIPAPLPRKPVAVMNTNPKPEGFRTAPFLPPPPSKGGKRDDRYAALESFAPPQSTTGGGDTFPSIFTTPPSLSTETQPAIFSQTSSFPQTFPSQNSFGNGDAAFSQTSGFPSGGFSSSGFSSGAFTPSGFSTAVFPPERVAGGYPQPSQQQFPQTLPFQTQPAGFPNQTTGFNTQTTGFSSQPTGFPIQSGGFPAQQSSVYSSIHNVQDSKPGAPADKLDSLFTDLDPLGSGKHKSFTDSPDVFSMNGSPRTGGGGASQDSLSNRTGLIGSTAAPPPEISNQNLGDLDLL